MGDLNKTEVGPVTFADSPGSSLLPGHCWELPAHAPLLARPLFLRPHPLSTLLPFLLHHSANLLRLLVSLCLGESERRQVYI